MAFPIDYRYGWNVANPEHQKLLLDAQDILQPDVIVMAPSCGPWSTSANRLTDEERDRLRAEEHETLLFAKKLAFRQEERNKGFLFENPWGSALWKKSVLSSLEQEIGSCRPKQRTDQCAFGATDETGKPVQKATGLQANFSLRNSTKRCHGHVRGHGVLQATFNGMNRTALAAVYPHQLCQAIIRDVKKFLSASARGRPVYFIGYKCQKCTLGKNAPPGVEHSLVPRECRHASALPTPSTQASSSSNRGSPSLPPPPSRTVVTTPITQLLDEFRQMALKKENLDEVRIQPPETWSLPAVDTLMLKHLLVQMVDDSINVISESKGQQAHWTQDPVHIAVLRKVFSKFMTVKGACLALHPDRTPQDRDRWEIDRVRGRAIRHHLQPRTAMFSPREDEGPVKLDDLDSSRLTTATPFDEPGPKLVIRDEWTSRDHARPALEKGRWTGTTEFVFKIKEDDEPVPEDPVVRAADRRERELDRQEDAEAGREDDSGREEEGPIADPPRRSNFDFRRVLVRLPRLVKQDVDQAKRLILGLHERFWHSASGDLQSLLHRAGMPAEVVKLVPEVVSSCAICKRFSKVKNRPTVCTNHPSVFNEEVQLDYFQLWDHWFMILIDVATRYKTVTKVTGRDLPTSLHTILHNWIRYFGPMRKLISDQESSIMSHEAAVEFERLNISRQPAGATRGKAQGQHTTTGLVEKHVELVKLSMLKLRADAERQGLEWSYADLAAEASFAQNATLNIGGYTPHMMVVGTLPMPYLDIVAPGIQAFTGANQVNPTVYERALRLRQLALTAATQAIVENRIARAGHTRQHRAPLEDMKPGVTEIEFHREDADGLGWRGPALLLKLQDNGSGIVEYQGRPYLIPLRCLCVF